MFEIFDEPRCILPPPPCLSLHLPVTPSTSLSLSPLSLSLPRCCPCSSSSSSFTLLFCPFLYLSPIAILLYPSPSLLYPLPLLFVLLCGDSINPPITLPLLYLLSLSAGRKIFFRLFQFLVLIFFSYISLFPLTIIFLFLPSLLFPQRSNVVFRFFIVVLLVITLFVYFFWSLFSAFLYVRMIVRRADSVAFLGSF